MTRPASVSLADWLPLCQRPIKPLDHLLTKQLKCCTERRLLLPDRSSPLSGPPSEYGNKKGHPCCFGSKGYGLQGKRDGTLGQERATSPRIPIIKRRSWHSWFWSYLGKNRSWSWSRGSCSCSSPKAVLVPHQLLDLVREFTNLRGHDLYISGSFCESCGVLTQQHPLLEDGCPDLVRPRWFHAGKIEL